MKTNNSSGSLYQHIYSKFAIKLLITDSLFLCAYCDQVATPVFEIRATVLCISTTKSNNKIASKQHEMHFNCNVDGNIGKMILNVLDAICVHL